MRAAHLGDQLLLQRLGVAEQALGIGVLGFQIGADVGIEHGRIAQHLLPVRVLQPGIVVIERDAVMGEAMRPLGRDRGGQGGGQKGRAAHGHPSTRGRSRIAARDLSALRRAGIAWESRRFLARETSRMTEFHGEFPDRASPSARRSKRCWRSLDSAFTPSFRGARSKAASEPGIPRLFSKDRDFEVRAQLRCARPGMTPSYACPGRSAARRCCGVVCC